MNNTAVIDSFETDPVPDDETVVVTAAPDLELIKGSVVTPVLLSITNSASVSSNETDSNVADNTDGVTDTGTALTVTYTLTVTNNGNADASGVTIVDTLPTDIGDGYSLALSDNPNNGTPTLTIDGALESISWTIASLPVGVPAFAAVTSRSVSRSTQAKQSNSKWSLF